jgi:glutamate synthase (NADPH/NADH) small chain
MEAEGVVFKTSVNVGVDINADELRQGFDAIVLAGGATKGRDLPVPGRELEGVHFAMEFLPQQNKRVAGDDVAFRPENRDRWWFSGHHQDILATDKHVIVIGGGDTGSDCVGTSNRQGARSVTQFELLAKPPEGRPKGQPWPFWPMKLRTSSSHEEGCDRHWSIMTKRFNGDAGRVTSLVTTDIEFVNQNGGPPKLVEVPGTEKTWPADHVLLSMGFVGPEPDGIIAQLGCELDNRGNIKADEKTYATTIPNVFACGDMRRGQSLVVWAISEGREAARAVDLALMKTTKLPAKGDGDLPRV